MQVIKRDGREVQFDVNKIITAVKSANANVADKDKLTDNGINGIAHAVTKICESLHRAIHVEEIQDFIISEIAKSKHMRLALDYSEYRLHHEMLRKRNSTDAKILSLLRHDNELAKQENANKDPVINSTIGFGNQR